MFIKMNKSDNSGSIESQRNNKSTGLKEILNLYVRDWNNLRENEHRFIQSCDGK